MKRLSQEDRETIIDRLVAQDIESIRQDPSGAGSAFRNGITGYANMPDDTLLEIAEDLNTKLDDISITETDDPEQEYLVQWNINVSAPTPRDAAIRARYFQSPGTTATVFDIQDTQGHSIEKIDLSDEAPVPACRP